MASTTLYGLDYEVPQGECIELYRTTMRNILSRLLPELTLSELDEGIDWSMAQALKNYKQPEVKIHNSNTNREYRTDILSLTNELLKTKPIFTGVGVLFQRHGVRNPFYNFIQFLIDKRQEAKDMMKKYPKGSDEYNHYNLLQNNYKVSCNGLYGIIGAPSCTIYNLYMATAVTAQGRSCISAAINMFEGLIGDNMYFGSLTEVLQFIEFVNQDIAAGYKFNDWDVLDKNITAEQCLLRLINRCGWNRWVPSDEAVEAIWRTLINLDQKVLNVVYYKNNLYEFCNNTRVKNLIVKMLVDLPTPFLNPNKLPKEISDNMIMFKDLLYEYCYYRHIWIDKLERVYEMNRNAVLITDTDSCIVCFDEWYRMVLEWTKGIPMNIKYTQAEILQAVEKEIEYKRVTEPTHEYDFYNDQLVEAKRKKYPLISIEEDNLRYSIINIIAYVISELIMDYMILFSENYNTATPGKECLLIMKNEFLFKSLLLTFGAKNYANLQILQEGNMVPESKQLDIKGMPISKVGIPASTKQALQNLLEFDVLRSSIIDQVDIFKKLTVLEKTILQSLHNKSKEYHKVARIKTINSYDNPMIIQGIKASYAYNNIKSSDEMFIDLEQRNTVLVIKTVINNKNVGQIKDTFPLQYKNMCDLLTTDAYKKDGISALAIPTDIEIPDWMMPFINYREILQDNLRNFPLDEIGMSKNDSNKIIKTNIISF